MEKRTLAAESAYVYDLATIVPNFNLYDPLATVVIVKVEDTEVGSPTQGQYINSEAVVSVSTNETTGAVTVTNYRTFPVQCHITISTVRSDGV
jgi:hypothetical protein